MGRLSGMSTPVGTRIRQVSRPLRTCGITGDLMKVRGWEGEVGGVDAPTSSWADRAGASDPPLETASLIRIQDFEQITSFNCLDNILFGV